MANMVPGIGPSPDRMVLGRMFAYGDSSRYRTGTNYEQLPVNRPLNDVHNYNKDGPMRHTHPREPTCVRAEQLRRTPIGSAALRDPEWAVESAEIMRAAYAAHRDDDDFVQPGTLYRQVMSPTDRDHLVGNIVWQLSHGVERFIQERAVTSYLSPIDADLGARVAKGLGI